MEDYSMSDAEPVRIVLTPEQREVVKRMSGPAAPDLSPFPLPFRPVNCHPGRVDVSR
jgi:hypothetical protein